MFRLRRYRYYVFFAAIVVFLLFRVAQNSEQWETVSTSFPHAAPPSKPKPPPASDSRANSQAHTELKGFSSEDDDLPQRILDTPDKAKSPVKVPDLKNVQHVGSGNGDVSKLPPKADSPVEDAGVVAYDHDEATKVTTGPVISLPDQGVGQGAKDAVHWEKVPEHFPIPASEVIPLPTGKPKKIPTIQYAFEKESPAAREVREARQQQVKAEMERGWAGYWQYARGHDELSPVTKKFRDPFCGWAATLVDSLDTLWIMGMEDEFKDALLEVEKIDFTVSKRAEIPVFETTIRYLGGLLAAYDVSGGKSGGHDILLEKAVELAEILMGVFDTPNRMPVLYYNWKPSYASRPRRAGNGVSVAELGSLAMEFTRLAQLTKENRYYDAVARITDAFYEWQERGTSIPGIFPEHVDASGCNHTAQSELDAAKTAAEAEAAEKKGVDSIQRTGMPVKHDDGLYPASDVNPETPHGGSEKAKSNVFKRSEKSTGPNVNFKEQKNPKTGKTELVAGESTLPECVSMGLTPSGSRSQQYSMGGSQDSTYEYFPKQWLLLGGLEPKYKELHLKVSEAVKKWLLYRPMVPDDRDILFSAKVLTSGEPETDAHTQYEVTHLTCFIGGMFGMGGKIFEVPADVEIGKKLTDGCVWAYESTATGIMPEGAQLLPCPDSKNCQWNQTLYEQALDPMFDSRDEQVEEYYKRKAKAKAAMEKAKEEKEAAQSLPDTDSEIGRPKKSTLDEKPSKGSQFNRGIQKRGPISGKKELEDISIGSGSSTGIKNTKFPASGKGDPEDSDPAPGFERSTGGQIPLQQDEDREEEDPLRPLTHKEYVANKIENEKLPKGFVDVNSRSYILRPEAIESVWYMYRITGDKKWQDKGWKMFEAIVKYTATEAGNSAISNVLITDPNKLNEMESFWTAETLKYFYLLYSEPNLISLDNWVLNTEAHPFKRPKAPFGV
ncbi:glycoside hydrolase family 47 protein [Xylaria sp. FL0933]|nr:glycoside hydrolase family 47 protein [Xylaria sp. FL0933]